MESLQQCCWLCCLSILQSDFISSILPTVWYRRVGLVYGIFGRLRRQRLAESTVLFVLHPCSHLSSATVSVSGKWSTTKVKTAIFNRFLLGSVYWWARRCFHTDWQHCSTMRFLREIRLHLQTISALWKCAVWTHSRPGWESTWKCEPWFMSCSIFQCHHRPTAAISVFLRQKDLGQMIWPCHMDGCAGWSCPQFYVEVYDNKTRCLDSGIRTTETAASAGYGKHTLQDWFTILVAFIHAQHRII
jgi:hypothetical protein